MSITTDLVEGFAQLLADADIGLSWSDTGAYTTGQTGIFVMVIPASPDRLVALTPYGAGDDATQNMSRAGLQVRSRSAAADPRDVFAIDDQVADTLLGLFPVTLAGGIHVQTLQRVSAVSLGQDDNRRWEWASNYTLDFYRPSAHRT